MKTWKKATGLATITLIVILIMLLCTVQPATAGTPGATDPDEYSVFWDKWDVTWGSIPYFCQWSYMGPGSRVQNLYTAQQMGLYNVDSGPIGEIGFVNAWGKTTNSWGYWAANNDYLNMRIVLSNVPTTTTQLSSTFASNYGPDGGVVVYYQPGWTNINGIHNQAFWFDITAAGFNYDGNGLVVEVTWDSVAGGWMGVNFRTSVLYGYWTCGLTNNWCVWGYTSSTQTTGFLANDNVAILTLKISAIPADIRMEPQTLNLDSMGNFVQIKVEGFPENPEYSPLDVDGTSVKVAGTGVDLKYGTWNNNRWIGKADILLVEDAIGAPGDEVEIPVSGVLYDGTAFQGMAVIDAH
ncbi:MAG: hypothetical protein KAJ51_00755 [Thermoplasmata archaeon]|nr:hypothetical protein [Thermoplasmata archaeon]